MPSTARNRTVPLGELVAAVFDQAEDLMPAVAGDVAARVVAHVLLRTSDARAVRALQAAMAQPG
jgi:hypothetical protein